MAKKVVIHIFHDDPDSLNTGSHVAERIRQLKEERGVEPEVYLFGPAERAIEGEGNDAYREAFYGLVEAVVTVHTCVDIANAMGKAEDFTANGLKLEYARSLRAPCPRKGDGDQLLTLGRGLACCSHRLGGVRSTAIYSRLMCRRQSWQSV